MFTFIIILMAMTIILAILFILYTAIALIIMAMKKNKIIGSGSEAGKKATIEQLSKIHIYLWAILKFGPFRFCNEDNYKQRLKASILVFNILGIATVIAGIMISSYLFAISSSLITMDMAMTSFIPTWITTTGNKDCICYVECTCDAEDDKKCTYELIFGPDEYLKFLGTFRFTEQEHKEFDGLKTGREIGYFLADRLTEDSVNCYTDLISGKKFRSGDHVNRDAFNFEGYKGDLIKLLRDYKENGRNPNCKCCKSSKKEMLKIKCLGVKRYAPGWTWEDDPPTPVDPVGPIEPADPGNKKLGTYTGHYQITLNDGTTWAVYHQSTDGCVHCSPCSCTSGQAVWGNTPWGNGQYSERHSFAEDGCAVYSLAMTITNLTGQDITPHQILLDLGVTYENGVYDTGTSSCFSHAEGKSGRGIIYNNAVNTLAAKYNIHTAELTDKSEILTYLDKNCMIWGSWSDADKVDGVRVLKHGKNDFLWYCGTNHFMTIRAKDSSNNLYVLSSSGNKDQGYKMIDVAQAPETVDNVWNHKSSKLYAFWTDTQTGGGGGYIVTADEQKLYQMFKQLNVSDQKAWGLTACYRAATECGLSSRESIGLIACAMAEGEPGLIQYGFHVTNYSSSKASAKFYIDSAEKANRAIQDHTESLDCQKNRGCGTAQWTNGRELTYLESMVANCTSYDAADRYNADYLYYKQELNGGYKSLITGMPNHNSTLESILCYSWAKYEAGFGNYHGDVIEEYKNTGPDWAYGQLTTRYSNALALEQLFNANLQN